jgi:hypothetical protein
VFDFHAHENIVDLGCGFARQRLQLGELVGIEAIRIARKVVKLPEKILEPSAVVSNLLYVATP